MWGWGRIVGYTVVITVVYLVAQLGAILATAAVMAVLIPGFQVMPWLERQATSDGVALSAALLAAAMLCIPTAWLLVRAHEKAAWQFMGVRRVERKDMALAVGAILLFIAITDPINVYLFDRPLVPQFMKDAYATARKPLLLFVAVAIAAPVTEELLFRGFLFSALRSRGIRQGWVVLITTLLFTAVHTQYDIHDLTGVLMLGGLFGAGRARFDSVLPAMAMHAVANTVAFIETAIWMRM